MDSSRCTAFFGKIQRLAAFSLIICSSIYGQTMEGELRFVISDPTNQPVPAEVTVASRTTHFRITAMADSIGRLRLPRLPHGIYLLTVQHFGFEDYRETVEVRSAVPQEKAITLELAVVATETTVESTEPLLDYAQPGFVIRSGRQLLEESPGSGLGRSIIDVIDTMPGWLLEAHAVLHPRGSEYDTQYVIDGMPLYDNRSIGFAPPFDVGEFESVNVITGAIPPEYGRRLGGVIALDTRRAPDDTGRSSQLAFQNGSYDTHIASLSNHFTIDESSLLLNFSAGSTDRYLDPPSLENFTNQASGGGIHGRLDHDLSPRDRLSAHFRSNRMVFQVPNDRAQQAAGQRQDRSASETLGQVHYQHASSRSLTSFRGMVRDLTARLWSNPHSTPVYLNQDRGLQETVVTGSVTFLGEHHILKFGGDLRTASVREEFLLSEPDQLPAITLDFSERRRSTDTSAYLQDHVRLGRFTAAAGFRIDYHDFLIKETAISPRAAVSYYFPGINLLLRTSYDRIFQPPPFENLLLSNAATDFQLEDVEGGLMVPASRAHFYEVGLRKALWGELRVDLNHYWRRFQNYFDDDVFLNTGISFPIAFDKARIRGLEMRLEMPRWRGVSSFVSYSNMIGKAASPVTGGLFVEGGEAEELRDVIRRFPISQDQRNTFFSQFRVEPFSRLFVTSATRYGSGLPIELEDDDEADLEKTSDQPIPQAILDRVNLERGRTRPTFSFDVSVGFRFWESDTSSLSLQLDVRNLTDRLNVINFDGLFSGTALAAGRQVILQTRFFF